MLLVASLLFAWSLARYVAWRFWSDEPSTPGPDMVDEDAPPARPWSPPSLDTVVDLPDRGPVVVESPAEPTPDAEPVQIQPVDLVVPARVDDDPGPSELHAAPYDADRCWGCDLRCTRKVFERGVNGPSTADLIRGASETRYRGEHGYASDLPAGIGDVGAREMAPIATEYDPIAIARGLKASNLRDWYAVCAACVDHVDASRAAGVDPFTVVEPAIGGAVAEECPF